MSGGLSSRYTPHYRHNQGDHTALRFRLRSDENGGDLACSIAVDRPSRASLTGYTHSADFPATPEAFNDSGQAERIDHGRIRSFPNSLLSHSPRPGAAVGLNGNEGLARGSRQCQLTGPGGEFRLDQHLAAHRERGLGLGQ